MAITGIRNPDAIVADDLFMGVEVIDLDSKIDRDTQSQATKDGVNQWTVLVEARQFAYKEKYKVTLTQPDRPAITPGQRIRLGVVRIGSLNGNFWISAGKWEIVK